MIIQKSRVFDYENQGRAVTVKNKKVVETVDKCHRKKKKKFRKRKEGI